MANIDDILSDLGVGGDDQPKRVTRKPRRDLSDKDKHTLDQRPGSFSTLPSMPSSQSRFGGEDAPGVDEDPAVLQKRAQAPQTNVASAVSEVYRPEDGEATGEAGGELADLLIEHGGITPEQITNAQKIIEQTPGKSLIEVLLGQGAEEEPIFKVLAQSSGIGFERINLAKGLDGGFDGKLLHRLGLDFCQATKIFAAMLVLNLILIFSSIIARIGT